MNDPHKPAQNMLSEAADAPSNAAAEPVGAASPGVSESAQAAPREVGGRNGPDPTRYGDWEKGGRCIDF